MEAIIDAAMAVHRALGPGLLESEYEACLMEEFQARQITFRRQVPIPLVYRDLKLEAGFRLDLLVEELVIVELKACEGLNQVFEAQLLTYMRLAEKRHWLLINFNVPLLKQGIRRFIL